MGWENERRRCLCLHDARVAKEEEEKFPVSFGV